MAKWTSWWLEGPATGLGGVHRYTRIATGWTQSACSKGDENDTGERDDIDGLSEEQLDAIKLNLSEKRRACRGSEWAQ